MDDSDKLATYETSTAIERGLARHGYNMGDDCCPKCGCTETRNGICRECGLNVEEYRNQDKFYGREP